MAARLRFVQADFSDLPPAERQRYFDEEIRPALKDIVPEQRARYLWALNEEFPTFTVVEEAARSEPDDSSPEALVAALVRIADQKQLPKQKLTEFGLQLQKAGYIGLKSTTLGDDLPEEFLRVFPIPAGESIDLQKLLRLSAALAEFYLSVEVVAWGVWKTVAPGSRVRREAGALNDPRKLSLRYLEGDDEVSAEQIKSVIEKTRKVIAGLLSAMGSGGEAFAKRFAADFSPDQIFNLAKADKGLSGGIFGGDEARAWQKFKSLFQSQTVEVMEEKLHKAIAYEAESLMVGRPRSN